MKPTPDLYDEYEDRLQSCWLQLRSYGAVPAFEGTIATVRCHEDNVLLKQTVSEPANGRVLVVDGGGSLETALLGDHIADIAADNGWAGLIINGMIRDSQAINQISIGVKALGTNPRKSRKDGHGEVDVPVRFGGVTFRPGEHLVSDQDGIVVLPADA